MSGLRERIHRLIGELLREHRAPGRVAAAILVGAMVGCTPLFGFHLLICVALAFLLGLNQVIVYAAANLSIPPLVPFIGFASIQLGERILRGQFLPLDRAIFHAEPARAIAHRFFAAWMVGGLSLGAAVGLVGGGLTFVALRRRRPVVDPVAQAIDEARRRFDREPRKYKFYARMKYVMDPCYRAIAPKIPTHSYTIDLGTGLGMLPIVIGLLGEGRRVRGIEWDADKAAAGARAAQGIGDVEIQVGDLRNAELPPCDVITIVDVLHYYDDAAQRELLERCKRALRPSGRLLIRDGDGARKGGSFFTRGIEALVTKLGWNKGPKVKFRPIVDLEGDLRALGFAVERDEVAGRLHPGNVLLEARLSS